MNTENTKKWQKIVSKAWIDKDYKKRLLEDANAVMTEEGIEIPADIKVRVVEDSEKVRTLVLPCPRMEDGVENIEERLAAFFYITW